MSEQTVPHSEAETCFRWAYQLLLALAKRHLVEANATCGDNWPAGQQWHELVGSSHSMLLRRAREEAGIDHEQFLSRIRSGEYDVEDLYDTAANG